MPAVVDPLERRFHAQMIDIYRRAAAECRYRPTRFLQMVNERGGLAAAKDLLRTARPSEGLTILWKAGRLDLTVESLVLQEPWRTLFTAEELDEADRRLKELRRSDQSKNASGRISKAGK